MDFFNFFKGFLGVPRNRNYENDENYRDDFFREPNNNEDNNNDEEMLFNIFSNPVEMHRYFEQQMNEMMRSFGMFGGLGGDGIFGGEQQQFPPLEDSLPPEAPLPPSQRNLRDRYLKPGYEHAEGDGHKKDSDLDGQVTLEDLDKSLSQPSASRLLPALPPRAEGPIAGGGSGSPRMKFFGQSFSSKIIRRPDGSQEIHKTVVDQDGNETQTVTKQRGEQQYTITTKTDKFGRKEITEDMINVDEKDLEKFKQPPGMGGGPAAGFLDEGPRTGGKSPHNWFPFDKYFK